LNLQTFTRKVKFLFRGFTSTLLLKIFHRSGFNLSESILIFGSTRSGSTWLAEVVSSIQGNIQIFEPMNNDYIHEADDLGIDRHLFLSARDEDQPKKNYFERVLSGKLLNPWLCSQVSPVRALFAKRLVVKFVRGNMIIDWLVRQFAILPPALVIRHPCAIVASQLGKGWTPSKQKLLQNRFFEHYPEFRSQCEELDKPEQYAALAWCMRYFSPLALAAPRPFLLVSYESLVMDGEKQLTYLFDVWGLEFGADIKRRLMKPSNTVTEKSQVQKGRNPLAGWKSQLSEEQVGNIIKVLEIFGMTFYSEALEPDYAALERFRYVPH